MIKNNVYFFFFYYCFNEIHFQNNGLPKSLILLKEHMRIPPFFVFSFSLPYVFYSQAYSNNKIQLVDYVIFS